MKFRQIDESLQYIMTGEIAGSKSPHRSDTFEDRLARAKKIIAAPDTSFLDFMRMATQPDWKIEGLKEGFPTSIKLERTIPAGIADSTIRQELRRIKSFLPGQAYTNVPPKQRETLWIQILEGIFWREALVLTYIKDQTLLNEYPGLDAVLAALGLPVAVTSRIEPTTTTQAPVTTLPPKAKAAIQSAIDIETTIGKATALVAGDIVASTPTDPTKKNPLWLPTSTADKLALMTASKNENVPTPVTTKAPAKKKAVKKKAPAKKKAKKVVETDPNVLTEDEFNEMEKKSVTLSEERNAKIGEIAENDGTEADVLTFMTEWKIYSAEQLKALREEQLNRRKA